MTHGLFKICLLASNVFENISRACWFKKPIDGLLLKKQCKI